MTDAQRTVPLVGGSEYPRLDFLKDRSVASLRREIQNLVDSYSHPWDALAELLQNSVDSIRLHRKQFGSAGREGHEIHIAVNSRERSVRVRDTGIGFAADRLSELLAPHGTDKTGDPMLVGEKGVGLTYTIFVCGRYELASRSTDAEVAGFVEGAAGWRRGLSDSTPQFVSTHLAHGEFSPGDTYADITLRDVESAFDPSEDLFSQNPSVFAFLLRTKTAVGYLADSTDLPIEVRLVHVSADGTETDLLIPFRYMWPEEFLAGTIDIDGFKTRAATMDDRQKARELAGKALVKVGSTTRVGRPIRFHAVFAHTRRLWREISEKNAIVQVDEDGVPRELYTGGIFVGTKGMPTGVELDAPATGSAGYWPNFFMLLEDDSITFDVGRKAVPGRTKGMLKKVAAELFDEFRPYMGMVSRDPGVTMGESPTVIHQERAQTFNELGAISDLGVPGIGYLKHPDGQEAAVMALFHELVGAGILKGYYTLRSGLKETYDLWGWYRIPAPEIGSNHARLAQPDGFISLEIVLEFKYQAHTILSEFDVGAKQFPAIDLLVCWDVDERRFRNYAVRVETIEPDDVLFFGSNYRLVWPGGYNLGEASVKPVLALRRFLQDYSARARSEDRAEPTWPPPTQARRPRRRPRPRSGA